DLPGFVAVDVGAGAILELDVQVKQQLRISEGDGRNGHRQTRCEETSVCERNLDRVLTDRQLRDIDRVVQAALGILGEPWIQTPLAVGILVVNEQVVKPKTADA